MAAVATPAHDLDIDQRREAAAALRAEGLSYSAIGDALGVETATAYRDAKAAAEAPDDQPDVAESSLHELLAFTSMPAPPVWMARAACRGAKVKFFDVDSRPAKAKRVCRSCPVAADCFDYVMSDISAFMAGDGTGGHGQFQIVVDVAGAAFQLDRLFVEVFHTSPADGAERDKVVVPVILGSNVLPGYRSYLEHVVQPGETLWGIAAQHYGSGNLYYRLVAANPHTITNPNLIHPGQIVRVPRD